MPQLEPVLPSRSRLGRFASVKLGPQAFATGQQFCQGGQLADTPGPPQFQAVVGRNACSQDRWSERRSRDPLCTWSDDYLSR